MKKLTKGVWLERHWKHYEKLKDDEKDVDLADLGRRINRLGNLRTRLVVQIRDVYKGLLGKLKG